MVAVMSLSAPHHAGRIHPLTATSDLQLPNSIPKPPKLLLILLQCRLNILFHNLIHNLRTPPNERRGIRQRLQIRDHRVEESRLLDAFDEVVRLTLLLHHGTRLMRQNPDRTIVSYSIRQ